jgi:hypothetical protein
VSKRLSKSASASEGPEMSLGCLGIAVASSESHRRRAFLLSTFTPMPRTLGSSPCRPFPGTQSTVRPSPKPGPDSIELREEGHGLAAKLPTAGMSLLRWCASLTCQTLPAWVTDRRSRGVVPNPSGPGEQARRNAGLLMRSRLAQEADGVFDYCDPVIAQFSMQVVKARQALITRPACCKAQGGRTNAGICSSPDCEAEWIANPTHPIGACGPPETGRLPVGCETGALLAGRVRLKTNRALPVPPGLKE